MRRSCLHADLICSLERDRQLRPSPKQMLEHPWVIGIVKKKLDMAKWVEEVWAV